MGSPDDPSQRLDPDAIRDELEAAREALGADSPESVRTQIESAQADLEADRAQDGRQVRSEVERARRLVQAGDEMQQVEEAEPQMEDLETVFAEGDAEGDGAPSAGEEANRMQAFARILEEKRQLPHRIEQSLAEAGAPSGMDPGIEPGDESAREERQNESLRRSLISDAVNTALAVQPGTPQNRRVQEAVWQGLRRSVAELRQASSATWQGLRRSVAKQRQASSATQLVQSDNLEGPSLLRPGVAEAQQAEQLTPEERQQESVRFAEATERLQKIGQPAAVRRAAEAPGLFSAIREVAEDPAVAIPSLVAGSSIQSAFPALGAIVGAAAGPPGMFAGQFLGTMAIEEQAATVQLLAEEGVDISDPRDILAATADPTMRRRIRNRARNRGLAVGAVDGLFGAATAGLSRFGLSPAVKAVGGFLLETVGEGVSEVAGQAAGGQEISGAEAALESIAALGQSGVTTTVSVLGSELTSSERRLEQEIHRQLENADVEVPESQVARMLQRAIDNGGLEQPQSAAEQAFNDAVRRGEIEVEPVEEDVSPTQERLEEVEEEVQQAAEEETQPQETDEPQETDARADDEGGVQGVSDDQQAATEGDGAGQQTDQGAEATPEAEPTQTAQREPATPRQRLEALGLDPAEQSTNLEDVADLEQTQRLLEDLNATELEARRQEVTGRLDALQQPPEEREVQQPGDPQRLRAILQLIDEAITEREAAESGQAETDLEVETEPAPEPGEEREQFIQDVADAEPDLLESTARNTELQPGEADVIRTEVERRRSENTLGEQEAELILQALDETTGAGETAATDEADADVPAAVASDAPSASEQAPAVGEIEEGAELVDVGGTAARRVTIQGAPSARTVRVQKETASGETIETVSLLQNLRREGEVEEAPPGSAFPEAEVDEAGRAVLTDEYQVIPENAIVPAGAEVRFDMGSSDLPVARRDPEATPEDDVRTQTPDEGQDLTEAGHRTPIRQEERITEQIEQVERELEQARKALADLKAQRPEQQRQQEGQETLFGAEEAGAQPQQPSLSSEMEASAETTAQLQDMIDQQRAVVDELQQGLIDLRRRGPEAQAEARRSQRDMDATGEASEASATEAPASAPSAAPPRSAASLVGSSSDEAAGRASRARRAAAIAEDLFSVVRSQWRGQDDVQRTLTDVARAIDHIRELRAAAGRGVVTDQSVERDVASMRSHIDALLRELDGAGATASLAGREVEALRGRIQDWTATTGDPGAPDLSHLNLLTGDRQAGPRYETEGGYAVRTGENGGLEVLSPNTGAPIDRRSSNYDDVVVEYFAENSEAIDEAPRVTDANPELSFAEWVEAAASSRNPFEIIEALLIARSQEAFDPVVLRLREAGRIDSESLAPYLSRSELVERGAGNWVTSEPGAHAIENIARDLQDWGIDITPQQIVDDYILRTPGGPQALEQNPTVGALAKQFESVTGLPITPALAERIHEAAYEHRTDQTQDDRGTSAPFEPGAPYVAREAERRSSVLRREEGAHERRGDGRSLGELAEDGYELRPGAPESAREDGVQALATLALYGPPDGATRGERQLQGEPTLTEATTSERRRVLEGLLGRAITDDLAAEHSASLIGRTVAGPDDLAALAQIYRDPRFETLRFFFVREREDGTQEIVHQTGVSTRLPGTTKMFPVETEGSAHLPDDAPPADELGAWEKLHYWMAHQMDALGADGYYVLHNHPSGDPTPSNNDERVTRRLAFENEGFQGHVIIDSGTYQVLETEPVTQTVDEARSEFRRTTSSADRGLSSVERQRRLLQQDYTVTGREEVIDDPDALRRGQIDPETRTDRLLAPDLHHSALGRLLSGRRALVDVGLELVRETQAPVVVMRGSNGRVRGLMEVDTDFLRTRSPREVSRQVLALARHTGATQAFLTNVPSDLIQTAGALTERGVFLDFVTKTGRSRTDYDVRPSRSAKTNQFGVALGDIDPVRVQEPQEGYGEDLRDEIRRRVGRLQHNAPEQTEPAPDSGPTEGEHIRQAAIRVEGQLYRGATHPEALRAALDDGAVVREGGSYRLSDGRTLTEGVEAGDVSLDLYTTSGGLVVGRQEIGSVAGVQRADKLRPPPQAQRQALAPRPSPRRIAEALVQLRFEPAAKRAVELEDVPQVTAIDYTIELVEDRDEGPDIVTSLNDRTINSAIPVSAPDVIRSFIDIVRAAGREVPVRYGRYRGFRSDAIGVFKVQPEVVRLEQANDIPAAAHELAHALEKAVFGWVDGSPWQEAVAGTDGAVQDELIRLGRELYGDESPKGGYKREGFARFMEYYLVQSERAEEEAPAMHEWFEDTFLEGHPQIADAVEEAQEIAGRWYDQGSIKRALTSFVKKESLLQTFKETILTPRGRRRLKTQASKAVLTEFSPFLRLVEEAEARMGESLGIEENPFLTAEGLAKTHQARARKFVEQGTYDFQGNPKGPPLNDIANLVAGQRDEFTLYLWARRALKLWEGRPAQYDDEGNLVQTEKEPRNPGLSKEDAQYIFDQYDSEPFRLAAEKVYQWNNDVLDYTKAAFDPEMAERIKGGDVGDYIPLQRVFNDLDASAVEVRQNAQRGGQQGVLGSDPVESLYGSSRRIRDPFQVMIEQATDFIRATHEKYILKQLINLSEVEGMGRFIEEVPRDDERVTVSVDRIVDDLRQQGLTIDVSPQTVDNRVEEIAEERGIDRQELNERRDELREEAREQVMREEMAGFLTFFKPAIVPETGDPIVAIMDEGQVRWFEVSQDLYDAMSGLDIPSLKALGDAFFGHQWAGTFLNKTLGATNRLFRLGTTGARPSFALITNPARDLPVLHAQSKSSANPARLTWYWMAGMARGYQSMLLDDVSIDPHFERMMNLGVGISRPLGVDTEQTRRAVRELFQSRAVRILTPTNWMDHIRDVLQIPELAPRFAEFKARAQELGWSAGEQMSEATALQLLLDAKQVTADFSSQGQVTGALNTMAPFVTATIAGQRAMARSFKTNAIRAMTFAMTMSAYSLAYWWRVKDEEWYKDLTPREKYNNWIFPIGESGPAFVLPRPFEWGTVFSAVPEAIIDAWYQQNPEEVKDVLGHVYANANPLSPPVPFTVLREQDRNELFYFNRPIVPRSEIDKPVAEQFGPYTSTVAIQIGRTFDVSPRRIDHLVAGFLGGVGRDATKAMDGLLATLGLEGTSPAVERERTASDLPVMGRLFRTGGTPGTQSQAVDDFYELLEEKQLIQASDVKQETRTDRQTRLMLQDAQKALSVLFWLRRHTKATEARQGLMVEIRELAQDAVQTAGGGLEAVLRKRGQLETLQRLDEHTGRLGPERLRPLIDRGLDALQRPDEQSEGQGSDAQEAPETPSP